MGSQRVLAHDRVRGHIARFLYVHAYTMQVDWGEIYQHYNFIKSQDDKLISEFVFNNINSDSGWFLNRLGGSDFDAVFEYFKAGKNINNYDVPRWMSQTRELNGYFDKSTSEETQRRNFIEYLERMHSCYMSSDAYMNAVHMIQNNFNTKCKNDFNKSLCRDRPLIHYYYIESIYPFLRDFKVWGEGKKILIVSPFSESIKYQTKPDRINNLINNYTFPNFTLVTYDTPITYNADITDLRPDVDTNNWIEQCRKMEEEISQLDFDTALLACASYATCLGSFISNEMGKKAIYIGGPLNVMFNIEGKRYNNHSYNIINNLSYRIVAFEKERYQNLGVKGGRKYDNEAFNAYF